MLRAASFTAGSASFPLKTQLYQQSDRRCHRVIVFFLCIISTYNDIDMLMSFLILV